MSQITSLRCDGCGTEEFNMAEVGQWIAIALAIQAPRANAIPVNKQIDYCPNCWSFGNTLYETIMMDPDEVRRRFDMIQAENARQERIDAAEGGMLAYHYPTQEEINGDAGEDSDTGTGPGEDGDSQL